MTTFDELVGAEPTGAERARLRNAHELLLEAGPPPEITPELEAGPTLDMTLGRGRSKRKSRRTLFVTVAAAALVTLIIALATTGQSQHLASIPLQGTPAAPQAVGTLTIQPAEGRTQTMRIVAQGLEPGKYAVYLLPRHGDQWKQCGAFTVKNPAGDQSATVNSPYLARRDDTWVVTRVTAKGRGVTVLRPAAKT